MEGLEKTKWIVINYSSLTDLISKEDNIKKLLTNYLIANDQYEFVDSEIRSNDDDTAKLILTIKLKDSI